VSVFVWYIISRGEFSTFRLLTPFWMAGWLAGWWGFYYFPLFLVLFLRRFVFNKAWQEPAVDWPDGWTDGLGGQKHIRADFLRFHNREGCIIFVLTLT
jgi:hypothetical protein